MQPALWLTLLCVWPLAGCYVTSQALHQNDLFNTRQPVDTVLSAAETPPKTKEQLLKVRQVLAYAADQGLNTEGAYEYVIQTRQPVVSYLVQAAKDDQLTFVTWWFPIVGEVPYLGFFRQEDSQAEADRLRAQGYDVSTGGVGAFSSLGWFADPIFSSMLERGDAELAHLFFHELTHRTLWVAGSPAFNENLAEYVAFVLTQEYLAKAQTPAARDLILRYQQRQRDKELFTAWLQALKADLTALYDPRSGLSRTQVLLRKKELFGRYQAPPLKPAFAVVDFVGKEVWNNASVLGAALYAPNMQRFAQAHRCIGSDQSVRHFLTVLQSVLGDVTDPFVGLDRLCRGKVDAVGEH